MLNILYTSRTMTLQVIINFLFLNAALSIPTPTYCNTVCTNPATVSCNLECGCSACFSTYICDKFNKQLNLMYSINTNDTNIKNMVSTTNKICDTYKEPDWSEYTATFGSNCVNFKSRSCKNYCKQCNTEILCNTVKSLMTPIMITYTNDSAIYQIANNTKMTDCTSDAYKIDSLKVLLMIWFVHMLL